MKVISAFGGRAILRWAPEDVIPPAGYTISMLFGAIEERYGFQDAPNAIQAQIAFMQAQIGGTSGGAPIAPAQSTFRSGFLRSPHGVLPIPQFDLFLGTGILIVTMQTTEDADLFLDDLTEHLQQTLNLRAGPATRIYTSSLVVEFEKGIEKQISVIGRAVELIREELGAGEDFNFERLSFGRDGFRMPASDQLGYTNLLIERRSGQPFEANRYYCIGPLRTKAFVRLLEKMEAAFE